MNQQSSLYQEISQEQLERLMARHFGAQPGLRAHLIQGGLFNTTYLVTLTSPRKEVVLRLGPINRQLLMPFEHNLMRAEAQVYALCAQHGVPASKVLALDTSRELVDRDFMVVERIPGVALSELQLEEAERAALYRQAGAAAKGLHAIIGQRFGRISQILEGGGFDSWREAMLGEIACWKRVAEPTGLYTSGQLARIDDVFARHAQLFDAVVRPRLVHADLWAGNVLVSGCEGRYQLSAIIDADRALFGDVDFEFASPWMVNEAFLEGYGAPLNQSKDASTRRKLYLLLYNLLDSYVWLRQYNNPENSDACRARALQGVSELL